MGLGGSNTSELIFERAEVPVENRLGEEGQGYEIALSNLAGGRIGIGAQALGIAAAALEQATAYAKEREQHGKPIAKHQLVQEHLAMIEMHRVATDALVMKAAEAKDASHAAPQDSVLRARAELLAAQAKLFASNAAWDAADRAVQVLGGRGWSTLYRPGRHLMDVRVCRIYEGTDEILKLKVAAAVLGKEYEAYK